MLPPGRQHSLLSVLLWVRLLIDAILGATGLILGVPLLLGSSGSSVVEGFALVIAITSILVPCIRSLVFLLLGGYGAIRLRRDPTQSPWPVLLAACLDLPMVLGMLIAGGLVPFVLKGDAGSTILACVLLASDLALIVLSARARGPSAEVPDRAQPGPGPQILQLAPHLAGVVCMVLWGRLLVTA